MILTFSELANSSAKIHAGYFSCIQVKSELCLGGVHTTHQSEVQKENGKQHLVTQPAIIITSHRTHRTRKGPTGGGPDVNQALAGFRGPVVSSRSANLSSLWVLLTPRRAFALGGRGKSTFASYRDAWTFEIPKVSERGYFPMKR